MSGSFRQEDIIEVQERSNIVEVISEYVTLKKSGRSFKALCPFHKEKTPSFMVDPVKQLFHCFGCDEGGNVFNFVMKIENLDFPEAVRTLAARSGYELTIEQIDKKKYSRQNRLFEINNLAMLAYQRRLLDEDKGSKARAYLKQRGYETATINAFKLGLAPSNWDDLTAYLQHKGFSVDEVIDAGLAVRGEKSKAYDRFRSRIIFPILDQSGRTVGFGGRVFDETVAKDAPKYLNSPETPIYHKSSILYWLNGAKSAIARQSLALIVEGYTDVISLNQAGFENVVATCGTALTSEHLRLLSRFTEKIILVFDADTAGKAAAERGLELLSDQKADLYVLSLPAGVDPAEYIAQEGKEAFGALLKEAVPLIDFCLDRVIEKHDINSPLGKAKAGDEALAVVARLSSHVAQEEYLGKISSRMRISYDSLLFELNKIVTPKRRNPVSGSEQEMSNILKLDPQSKAEREILKFILQCPEYAGRALSEIDVTVFSEADHRDIFKLLKISCEESKAKLDVNSMLNEVDDGKRKLISKLMMDSAIPEEKDGYFKDILSKLKEFEIQRQINTVRLKLERLNPSRDPVEYDALFEELIDLEASKRDLQYKR